MHDNVTGLLVSLKYNNFKSIYTKKKGSKFTKKMLHNKIKIKWMLLTLMELFSLAFSQSGNSGVLNNNLLINARIQCEYKDKDGDSLILNCTLFTGLPNINSLNMNQANKNQDTSGISINSLNINGESNLGGISSSSNGVNIRVGLDKNWRTPWESLSINHNIIRTFIWRSSKLSELGNYAFKDLYYLQRIDLSNNKLQELNSNVFNSFELDLLELDLSNNLFQQVPFDLFLSRATQNIEILRLNDNPIVHLSRKPFEIIKNSLKLIELNHCQIRSIDLNTFDDMKYLESISLVGNHLRYLNEYTFKDLNLRSFYIHDNPLMCDCHMRWLIGFLKNVDYQQQSYDSQVVTSPSSQNTNMNSFWSISRSQQKKAGFASKPQQLSVGLAAQQSLKCDQPNSLKSQPNFLDINPDSFMCDVQISLRDNIVESVHDLGEDALIVCDVYGDPEPNIYWSFGKKPIEKALNNEDDKYQINEIRSITPNKKSQVNSFNTYFISNQNENVGILVTNKTSELRIKNLQSSDIGYYTCTAEIVGSNNRKQITFNLKQLRGNSLTSFTDASGIVYNSVTSLAYSLFNRPLSNWTLLLLLGILVSLIIFILVLSTFICWKCRKHKNKEKIINEEELIIKDKEQEKLLFLNGATANILNDHLDHHNPHYNQNYLQNDSSTTLLSNKQVTNSIRMAYPNPNTISNGNHTLPNHTYTNHSLLTTTSTKTGSYLTNGINNINSQTIAIDTSNHTPRFLLLNQNHTQTNQNGQDGYYDDLRYNNEDVLSSPFKQQQPTYSPLIRRDDPTIPLYATLKPKSIMQNNQRQFSNIYQPYSTINRNNGIQNTPPLPMPRKSNNYQLNAGLIGLPLPPPPPPPPSQQPPIKPKRTFEYAIGPVSRDLHSESGTFLISGEDSLTIPMNYDQQYDMEHLYTTTNNNRIENILINKSQSYSINNHGSTTSLDEEDLDLNDLKDFEDVTFDNLRKPNENSQKINNASFSSLTAEMGNQKKTQKKLEDEKKVYKQKLEVLEYKENTDKNITNSSEQSLLLKSSGSSFENTINNTNIKNKENEIGNSMDNSNGINSKLDEVIKEKEQTNNDDIKNPKIYEETEI